MIYLSSLVVVMQVNQHHLNQESQWDHHLYKMAKHHQRHLLVEQAVEAIVMSNRVIRMDY